jgi:hypothetical protein
MYCSFQPTLSATHFLSRFLMISVLQDVISWRSYLLLVCVVLTITSLISAGHHLEDEVKHSAMFGLILNDFSVRENVDEFFYPKMVHLEYQKPEAFVDNFDQHN